MANLLHSCALFRTDLDGYGHPGAYQVYNESMHLDGLPLDQEMHDEFGQHMGYNSMVRPYPDNF